MDGNTLLAKVRSNVNTNHIPIILLTAKVRDEEKLESLELGADLYITKPFNMDILKRNVANLLKTRKMSFSRFFKLHTGRNLSDYIIDLRLGHACRLLVDSSDSIAEIGYHCGFNSATSFSTMFKKMYGMSPREYQRQHAD